jgi:hypothetical protein
LPYGRVNSKMDVGLLADQPSPTPAQTIVQ